MGGGGGVDLEVRAFLAFQFCVWAIIQQCEVFRRYLMFFLSTGDLFHVILKSWQFLVVVFLHFSY